MKAVERNAYWKHLRRAGIGERILNLIAEYEQKMTYKNAVELAGRLKFLAQICDADSYWSEKATTGYITEREWCDNHEAEIITNEDGSIGSVKFHRIEF